MSVFSRVYRCVAALMCLAGLAIQFGVLQGQFNAYLLNYFTVLSNIVCLIVWILLMMKPRLSPLWQGVAAQGILLTMTVYHFMLSGQFTMGDGGMNLFQIANIPLHYVCPTLMIIDLLFLAERQTMRQPAGLSGCGGLGGDPVRGLCSDRIRDARSVPAVRQAESVTKNPLPGKGSGFFHCSGISTSSSQ